MTATATVERITDENKAIDEALKVTAAETALKAQVRGLKERLEIAKELKIKQQVAMLQDAIVSAQRTFAIEHRCSYPQVTKEMAMNAMCEPIKKEAPTPFASKALASALGDIVGLGKAVVDPTPLTAQSIRRAANQLRAQSPIDSYFAGLSISQLSGAPMWVNDYSRETHKYDLACEIVMFGDRLPREFEGARISQVMLPMSALCRLKEAKAKDMFDAFEVWRPSEWKAPDPWLVGVQIVRMPGGTDFRYYKLCDWR